jgi:hypothetical protein
MVLDLKGGQACGDVSANHGPGDICACIKQAST